MGTIQNKEEARRAKLQASICVEFRRTLTRKYEVECKRNGTDPTFSGLLEFAEKYALIRHTDINRFMIIDLYPAALYNNDGCKSKAIADLEEVVPVSDRKIWSWIGDLSRRYLQYRNGKKQ